MFPFQKETNKLILLFVVVALAFTLFGKLSDPSFYLAGAFFGVMALIVIICGYIWDVPRRDKKPPVLGLAPLPLFGLPFSPGWLVVGLALVLLWVWAFTRKSKSGGSYIPDFWPMMALLIAGTITVVFALGVGVTWLLN